MQDGEMLKLAAKAAGVKALRSPDGILRNCTGFDPAMNIFAAPPWNPLTDDGDALRLAVDLGLLSHQTIPHEQAVARFTNSKSLDEVTRRAIVRAAVVIQQTKEAA